MASTESFIRLPFEGVWNFTSNDLCNQFRCFANKYELTRKSNQFAMYNVRGIIYKSHDSHARILIVLESTVFQKQGGGTAAG